MIADYFNIIKPYLGQILLGAAIGFIAGYTFKKAARALFVLILGLSAILIILINYTHLIDIDFLTIKHIGKTAKDTAIQHKDSAIHMLSRFARTNVSLLIGALSGFIGGISIALKK